MITRATEAATPGIPSDGVPSLLGHHLIHSCGPGSAPPYPGTSAPTSGTVSSSLPSDTQSLSRPVTPAEAILSHPLLDEKCDESYMRQLSVSPSPTPPPNTPSESESTPAFHLLAPTAAATTQQVSHGILIDYDYSSFITDIGDAMSGHRTVRPL
jgi:hypothetical protein